MDFEFTTFRQNMILISGAISDHHSESPILKLQGSPLELTRNGQVLRFNMRDKGGLVRHLKRVIKKKAELLNSVLNELEIGLRTSGRLTTLYPDFITNFMCANGGQPILVLWNGSNDVEILRRLSVRCPTIVNLTAYDEYNDNCFYLKLINYENEEVICIHSIGRFNKNGRMLSLSETHSIVCQIEHDITYIHDPVVDVLYTKCLFNYLVRQKGYHNILNYLTDQ